MQDTGTFSEPLSVHILVSRRRQRTGRACSSLVHGRTYRIRVLCFAFTGHTAFSGCHKDEDMSVRSLDTPMVMTAVETRFPIIQYVLRRPYSGTAPRFRMSPSGTP